MRLCVFLSLCVSVRLSVCLSTHLCVVSVCLNSHGLHEQPDVDKWGMHRKGIPGEGYMSILPEADIVPGRSRSLSFSSIFCHQQTLSNAKARITERRSTKQ